MRAGRDRFLSDLGWKVLSLVLAVAIWLTVTYKNPDETSAAPQRENLFTNIYSDLPVLPLALPAGAHAQISPSAVTVIVSGPRNKMATLQRNEICPQVNLSGVVSGSGLLRSVTVAVPPGMTYDVDPPEVTVTVMPPAALNPSKQP